MKAFVNRHLITQTTLDSGALTSLGAVIHQFPEPGEYLGVARRGAEAETFRLAVEEESNAMQVDVDLAALGRARPARSVDCECKPGERGEEPRFVVDPRGYVVFYVSLGAGGYEVHVGRLGGRPEEGEVFDSRELGEGDLFAVTLIRPGTYSVRNTVTSAKGEIVVAYPTIGKEPYRPPEPVSIECTERAFRPSRIRIQAAQGQVYRFRTPSRVVIELEKADDGPSRPRGPRARWTANREHPARRGGARGQAG